MEEELLIMKGGYIPKRYFSFTDHELQYKIQTTYPSPEWDRARMFMNSKRNKISLSAIKIVNVIKEKIDIDLFPLVIPVATKGFDISGGTASFCMHDKEGESYLFDMRARNYKSLKNEYQIYIMNGSTWIQAYKQKKIKCLRCKANYSTDERHTCPKCGMHKDNKNDCARSGGECSCSLAEMGKYCNFEPSK